ncbi:MAG: imidazolonepropionase [Acidimicrobiales bacterium]|nr:imidazolonepropionase [Hyphomonadaceae bacterium]RZV44399.1 MAG: imidazolonepropionase [Acidimicrobiales bacterium]
MGQLADILFTNVNLATMDPKSKIAYGIVENATLVVKNGLIGWAGPAADASAFEAQITHDCAGAWMTPGLIDCHTHLVFAGNRASEFEMRLKGASYEEIARAGGGIVSTVTSTRAASKDDLIRDARNRLAALKTEGVTTVEIKSGYGLDLENETKMLEAATALSGDDVRILRTFLGAHALPPEYKDDGNAYIDLVCNEMIPAIAKAQLMEAVDGFCENIAFSTDQIERVLVAAKAHGLPVKLHAEQLSDQGGSQLAARYGAISVDHLEFLSNDGVDAIAKSGTVAVLLPGAFYFLKETKLPPIQLLRDKNVPLALATDCNPGSSPITSPLLILNMACTLFGLTPEEALLGMTLNGAKALHMDDQIGSIEVGKRADLAIWAIDHPAELSYWMGSNPLSARIFNGKFAA